MNSCHTRYPLFLVHGVGFRDRKHLNYWGRIPQMLQERGAIITYGRQDSWATIEDNAAALQKTLVRYVCDTGCEKVNIIAHSKGGLEARYLASRLGCSPMIASITTVSTPHHGSKTMDSLQGIPLCLWRFASVFVDGWFRMLGDKKPNFAAACGQFTTAYMRHFNDATPDAPGVLYQSYATAMKTPRSDVIMSIPNWVVASIEGKNDGIVAVSSASWGQFGGVWEGSTARGISHPDAVDLRRRRLAAQIEGQEVNDICDCYLYIVQNLRLSGY